MWSHLQTRLSTASSIGTFVNNETTSKEISLWQSSTNTPDNFSASLKLFSTWLSAFGIASYNTSCKYFAREWREVPVEDTIIRKGQFNLWTFGSPYALGSTPTVLFKNLYFLSEIYSDLFQPTTNSCRSRMIFFIGSFCIGT